MRSGYAEQQYIFFEVKKTSISDELENMDDVTMLQQLAKGMVRAQKQCFYMNYI